MSWRALDYSSNTLLDSLLIKISVSSEHVEMNCDNRIIVYNDIHFPSGLVSPLFKEEGQWPTYRLMEGNYHCVRSRSPGLLAYSLKL